MSWEQRNADFCNAQTNAQMAYIEAEREVDRLEAENAKLRELVRTLHHCAARGECDVCAMRDGRGLDDDTVCFAAHDRMRELGVEV